MARINNLPILDSSGEIRGDVRLLRPLLDPQEIQTRSATQRWLEALEPWIAPLDYETLPAINTDTTNLWGKMHTMASEHERKRAEEKALKNRSKAAEKHQEGIEKAEEKRAKELAKLERKEQKARDNSHSHKADDKLRRIEEKREKVERKHDERMDKAAERSTTKDKEAKAMTKVLWLMIRNLHDDSGVSYYGNMEEET
ncbi:hypothetical protein RRF57_011340 [Xylaria bambusicola]|uniref:Uncharacterized protein n=1 Tax=Xylaria bambusicola TaxID=326684 RepID=A0AAN7UXY0_9PEZI